MSARKIIVLALAMLVLIVSALLLRFYLRYSKPGNISSYLPREAEFIFYLNGKNAVKQFLFSDADKSIRNANTRYKDYFINIPSVEHTGVNYLAGAAFTRYKEVNYLLLLLDDEAEFMSAIRLIPKYLIGDIKEYGKYKEARAERDSFVMVWNKEVLLFFPKRKAHGIISETSIDEMLQIKKGHSFTSDPDYPLITNEDALLWFYIHDADTKINEPATLKGFLNYDHGFYLFATDNIKANYDTQELFEFPELNNSIYTRSSNTFVNNRFLDFASLLLPEKAGQLKKQDLVHSQKSMTLKGKKIVSSISTSYEFDEDFNKKRIDKIEYDTVNECRINILSGKQRQLIFSNTDTTLFNFDSIPGNVKMMLAIDQNLSNIIYPRNIKYRLRFLNLEKEQDKEQYNMYYLKAETERLQDLLSIIGAK